MKENPTFGCLVFVLQNDLHGGTGFQNGLCARLGVNHGPSPMHAHDVNLLRKISMDLFSPQYLVRHDDFFETTQYSKQEIATPSMRQQLVANSEILQA